MRRAIFIFAALLAGPNPGRAAASPSAQSSRVVDRIVAHIEGDIILESQVRELAALQQLIEGHAEADDQLLSELIEQWMVQTEATDAHFPAPAASEIDRELARLAAQFPSADAYAARVRELGLSNSEIRALLERQIFVERYLDYKFRPSVQIETPAIESYYQNELLPELARKNQPAPQLADVQEQIRELLVQKGISELTAKWLDETRSRLKIERIPAAKP